MTSAAKGDRLPKRSVRITGRPPEIERVRDCRPETVCGAGRRLHRDVADVMALAGEAATTFGAGGRAMDAWSGDAPKDGRAAPPTMRSLKIHASRRPPTHGSRPQRTKSTTSRRSTVAIPASNQTPLSNAGCRSPIRTCRSRRRSRQSDCREERKGRPPKFTQRACLLLAPCYAEILS